MVVRDSGADEATSVALQPNGYVVGEVTVSGSDDGRARDRRGERVKP
ncbi:MAG: hypothetical protein AB1730_25460 [Myxococcota bacterium]